MTETYNYLEVVTTMVRLGEKVKVGVEFGDLPNTTSKSGPYEILKVFFAFVKLSSTECGPYWVKHFQLMTITQKSARCLFGLEL